MSEATIKQFTARQLTGKSVGANLRWFSEYALAAAFVADAAEEERKRLKNQNETQQREIQELRRLLEQKDIKMSELGDEINKVLDQKDAADRLVASLQTQVGQLQSQLAAAQQQVTASTPDAVDQAAIARLKAVAAGQPDPALSQSGSSATPVDATTQPTGTTPPDQATATAPVSVTVPDATAQAAQQP